MRESIGIAVEGTEESLEEIGVRKSGEGEVTNVMTGGDVADLQGKDPQVSPAHPGARRDAVATAPRPHAVAEATTAIAPGLPLTGGTEAGGSARNAAGRLSGEGVSVK